MRVNCLLSKYVFPLQFAGVSASRPFPENIQTELGNPCKAIFISMTGGSPTGSLSTPANESSIAQFLWLTALWYLGDLIRLLTFVMIQRTTPTAILTKIVTVLQVDPVADVLI